MLNQIIDSLSKPAGPLALCALITTASPLSADIYEWNVAGPDTYNLDTNWLNTDDPGVFTVPDLNDVVHIDNGGTVTVSSADPDWLDLARLQIGFDSGTEGFLEMTGGSLSTNSGEIQIGNKGSGTFTLSGGTVDSANHFYLALNVNAVGVFNQSGGTVNVASGKEARFGWRGEGTMNMTGGEFNADVITLGPRGIGRTTGVGTVNHSSGEINTASFRVGDNFNTTRTESGVYNLSGDGVLNAGELLISRFGGNGRIEMTGGEINITDFFAVGHGDGASGIFNQSGGVINRSSGSVFIGRQVADTVATGVWTLSGTAVANLDDVVIAQGVSVGTLTLNGGTLSATNIRSTGGTSTLNLNGGTIVARADNTSFLEGLSVAQVQAGGVTFDTDGKNVTVAQDLVDDGAGDVVKAGLGAITLSGENTYLGDTVVEAGSLFLAEGGSMTFEINEDGSSNMISGTGNLDLSGMLIFDFENIDTTIASSWTIIASTLTTSYGEGFAIQDFSETSAGIWTLAANNLTYEFNESTGILSAVPEPAQYALVAGLMVVGACAMRRKPKAII